MTEQRERRRFHRVGHDADATLKDGEHTWPCQVEDLSLKGALIRLRSGQALDPDCRYALSVHLAADIHIDMAVRLSHQQGAQAGFQCISIDSDSVAQLKRLVELNLGDSSLLERDMHALLGGDAPASATRSSSQ